MLTATENSDGCLHKQYRYLTLLLFLLLCTPVALAQEYRGTILGQVTDASKAIVPNATEQNFPRRIQLSLKMQF